MKTSLLKFSRIAAAVLIALTISSAVSAQTSNVDAMYEANSALPLGGFFAKGFTRTFTLLGGGNFTADDLPGDFSGLTPTSNSFPTEFLPIPVVQDTNDVGYVISGAMGRRHNNNLRSEIEFAVRGNDLSLSFPGFVSNEVEADVHAYSLMKNVIFDLPNRTRFTPYAGAGLGISLVEVEAQSTSSSDISFLSPTTANTNEVSEEDTALTYQFIGGVATRVNHAMDFVVEYRFLGTSDIELDTLGSAPYLVNNLFLGVKLEY